MFRKPIICCWLGDAEFWTWNRFKLLGDLCTKVVFEPEINSYGTQTWSFSPTIGIFWKSPEIHTQKRSVFFHEKSDALCNAPQVMFITPDLPRRLGLCFFSSSARLLLSWAWQSSVPNTRRVTCCQKQQGAIIEGMTCEKRWRMLVRLARKDQDTPNEQKCVQRLTSVLLVLLQCCW